MKAQVLSYISNIKGILIIKRRVKNILILKEKLTVGYFKVIPGWEGIHPVPPVDPGGPPRLDATVIHGWPPSRLTGRLTGLETSCFFVLDDMLPPCLCKSLRTPKDHSRDPKDHSRDPKDHSARTSPPKDEDTSFPIGRRRDLFEYVVVCPKVIYIFIYAYDFFVCFIYILILHTRNLHTNAKMLQLKGSASNIYKVDFKRWRLYT